MSYSVYLVKNRAGFFLDFEHPTCKGKSKSQPFAHTFALTGRGRLYADTQGVALGWGLAALSGHSFRDMFVYHVRMLCHLLFGKKTHRDFLDFEHPSKGYFRGVCHLHSSTNSLSLDKYPANL